MVLINPLRATLKPPERTLSTRAWIFLANLRIRARVGA